MFRNLVTIAIIMVIWSSPSSMGRFHHMTMKNEKIVEINIPRELMVPATYDDYCTTCRQRTDEWKMFSKFPNCSLLSTVSYISKSQQCGWNFRHTRWLLPFIRANLVSFTHPPPSFPTKLCGAWKIKWRRWALLTPGSWTTDWHGLWGEELKP